MTLTNHELKAIKGANLYQDRLRNINVEKENPMALIKIEEETTNT